jgi:hypothetical protein
MTTETANPFRGSAKVKFLIKTLNFILEPHLHATIGVALSIETSRQPKLT